MRQRDLILLMLFGLILIGINSFVGLKYFSPQWTYYQNGFRDYVAKNLGAEKASQAPRGLQQIWAKGLNRVDRCVTCHQGMEWKDLENAPHPFKSHPKEILQIHPPEKYGCSSCHGGQGFATDFSAAHGFVDYWEEPLLGKDLSDLYLIKDPKILMQLNCNVCHRYDRETKGCDTINKAKQLVGQKGCRACHLINGRGGVIGPDLSFVGEKAPEQYDYSRLSGVKTSFAWHVAHFQSPKTLVPDSVMPDFTFSTSAAQSLALLVLSWKRSEIPVEFNPGASISDKPTPEELEKEKRMMTGEGAFFAKKGCFICHSVSTLGIESATNIGPDLANAVADVQSRFGRSLDDFLMKPSGTMGVVLSTQIHLTDDEKKEAVAKLKIAYQKKLEEQKETK